VDSPEADRFVSDNGGDNHDSEQGQREFEREQLDIGRGWKRRPRLSAGSTAPFEQSLTERLAHCAVRDVEHQ